MALHKIKDFYPNYREQFDNQDVIGNSLYSGEEKVGSVDDLLVDDQGKFRYLVINTGAWIFGKKVLLPIGRAQIDYNQHRVYATGLSREQVENLPDYDGSMVDYEHEERVRGVYRPAQAGTTAAMGTGAAGTPTLPVEQEAARKAADGTYERNNYSYDRDADLYDINRHQNLKLYEERLIANKTRQKTGEVSVGKHVETETVHATVPVEKERLVINRVTPADSTAVDPSNVPSFEEGEVARVELYEESPDIRKEAFVREEVQVRKEVDRDTVEADETIRKEQLDIKKQGNPDVRNANARSDRR